MSHTLWMLILAAAGLIGWICAAVALWRMWGLQNVVRSMRPTTPNAPTEVERRLQQLTTVPAQTRQYAPGKSTQRVITNRTRSSISQRI